MRHQVKAARMGLGGLFAGLMLVSCAGAPSERPLPASPSPSPPPYEAAPPPETSSNPRFGDSDDHLCDQGPPEDPRTVQACARLRGPDAPPVSRFTGRFGDSDDNVCNNGPADDARTIEACKRLRGPTP